VRSGQEEAIEVEAVIWIGIAAIVVIAVVIAAIGRPGDGGIGQRVRGAGTNRTRVYSSQAAAATSNSRRRAGSYSTVGYSDGSGSTTWGVGSGASSCGGDSGGGFGGGFGGSSFGGGDSGGSCGGGGGSF
jgi:hypothetical protein